MFPKNVLLYGVLSRVDDKSMFAVLHSGLIDDPNEDFWRHRMKLMWTSNVNNAGAVQNMRSRYLEIAGAWVKFIAPLVNYDDVVLTAIDDNNSACRCPYHMFAHRRAKKDAKLSLIEQHFAHQTLCMPSYILKSWIQDREVLRFKSMNDLLHWRDIRVTYFNRVQYAGTGVGNQYRP